MIACNILSWQFKKKPSGVEIGHIQNKMKYQSFYPVEHIATILANGGVIRPSAMNGNKDSDFESQQLFFLDFDSGKLKIDQAIERARKEGFPVCFAYFTFSSTQEKQKYRLVFCSDQKIADIKKRNIIQKKLMSLYPNNVDEKCGNPSRIFFGTNKGIYQADYKAVFDSKAVIDHYKPTDTKQPKNSPKEPQREAKNTVEAIKTQNAEYIRNKLNRKKMIFENKIDFFDYIYKKIDLAQLLEVSLKTAFPCVLPTHNGSDNNPSASVFIDEHGNYQYHCFTEGLNINLKQLIEIIGNFKSEYRAISFIKQAFNLEIKETEWAKEQRENIDRIQYAIATTGNDSFSQLCPIADNNIRFSKQILMEILAIAKMSIYPDEVKDGNIVFYMSIRQLATACKRSSIDKVQKYVKQLAYHKIIEIVPEDEIPLEYLEKAKAEQRNQYNHITFYRINSWVQSQLIAIEKRGKTWKTYGYTLKNISYDCFYRNEPDVALELYPQTGIKDGKQRKTAKSSDVKHDMIAKCMLNQITNRGYITITDTIEMMGSDFESQIRKSFQSIIDANNWKKTRLNKQLKAKYSIFCKGYPFIVIAS